MNAAPTTSVSVDFMTKTIFVSRAFLNASRKVGSPEFLMLKQLTEDMPSFSIAVKCIAHRKLFQPTYAWMIEYIQTQPDAQEVIKEFAQFRNLYRNYSQVRSWFVRKYPDAGNLEAFSECNKKYHIAA